MSILFYGLYFFWILRIVANVLTYVQLWRIKEYRLDRMLIHLRTPQGRQFLFPSWKRPSVTIKTTLLFLGTVGLLGYFYWLIHIGPTIGLLLIDILSFPVTFVLVGLMQIPTVLYHAVVIKTAVTKLRKHAPMTVIGITGSFGKTSTKDYAATILGSQFSVLKTDASKNSPIGIAEVIHSSLTDDQTIFIVEMGAYKKGEIEYMTQMVRPSIGVVTAINPQHQDLFGSLDATMEAKYELIAGLTGKRFAIFNADNDRTQTMASWARRDHCAVRFWTKDEVTNIDEPHIRATNIVASIRGVSFDCTDGKEKIRVHASVLGEHQVGNIIAAIAIATVCGMKFSKAARAASAIVPAKKVMEPQDGIHGSVFINDTFNNNPDAAKGAIVFLALAEGKKILVFQPMIELGEFAQPSHTDVGAFAAKYCDAILLTNRNFYHDFERGVRSVSETLPLQVVTPNQAASYIRAQVRKGDTVLFKGKEAEHTLRLLTGK